MSLRIRSLVILAGSLMTALTILAYLFQSFLGRQFTALEIREVQEHVRRVELALENVTKQLVSKTTDWAQWDDTYRFMQDRNNDYLHSNISFETLSAIFVTHVVYRDVTGSLVKGFEVDYTEKIVGALSPSADQILAKGNSTLSGIAPTATKSGLIVIAGQPYIFASIPIFDSRRADVCRGSLLFSVALDSNLEATFAEQTRLDIKLLETSGLRNNREPSLDSLKTSSNPVALPVSSEEVRGYELLRDINGNPIRVIEVILKRHIYAQGQEAIGLLISALVSVMILTLLVSSSSLNRWVLKRLSKLQNDVELIDSSRLNGARVTSAGNDELTSFARAINSMLQALEHAQQEAKLARLAAERANFSKSMLIARISHELRNQIHGIMGIINIVLKRDESRAVWDTLELGYQSAKGLLSIVDEVLDFSKAESGQLTFEKISFDLRQLVRETLSVTAARLEGRYKAKDKDRLELVADINPSVPKLLEGDPTKLKQVIINLLSNAIKFTKNGFVGLKVNAENHGTSQVLIKLTVWDTGVGINQDKLAEIFEPFKQADETVARNYQGSGLGLAIVKQFVDGMNGNITVTSTAGKGSQFTVSLTMAIATDDTKTQAIQVKRPASSVLVAHSSPVSDSILNNLKLLGINAGFVKPEPELSEQTRDQLLAAELLAIDEDALSSKTVYQILEQRLANNKQSPESCTIVMIRPSSIKLRDSLYLLGPVHVLTTPVIADDLLAAYQIKQDQLRQAQNAPAVSLQSKKKLKIIIADDMPTNLIILEDMLLEAGHEVVSVADGKDIINLVGPMLKGQATAEHFDLVITDVTMNSMNGDEATRVIRDLEQKSGVKLHLPVIALTGHALVDEQQQILSSGVDAVLSKPIEPESLARTFDSLFK